MPRHWMDDRGLENQISSRGFYIQAYVNMIPVPGTTGTVVDMCMCSYAYLLGTMSQILATGYR